MKCTFYGLRSPLDADLRQRMDTELQSLAEKHEEIEFLFYLYDTTHMMFLAQVMKLKAQNPTKRVKLTKVIASEGSSSPGNYYVERFSTSLPMSIFDKICYADKYEGKADKNSPGYMMIRHHSIERWIFDQCDIVFTYCYPELYETENTEIKRLENNPSKTTISVCSPKTEERIKQHIKELDESRQMILERIAKGDSLAQIGNSFGVSGNAIKQKANKSSRVLREYLRRDYMSDLKSHGLGKSCACGILGLKKQSNIYTHDLLVTAQFLSSAFGVTEFNIEQDLCFTETIGPMLSKNMRACNGQSMIAVIHPSSMICDGVLPIDSYCPPYDNLVFVGADDEATDEENKISTFKFIIEKSEFIITDLMFLEESKDVIALCAQYGTRIIDLSSIPQRE